MRRASADAYDAGVSTDCLFCGIVAGTVPSTKVYEDDLTLAFRDIHPAAPVHVLVIPKAHYADLASLVAADPALASSLLAAAAEVARVEGIAEAGYRMVVNTGKDGGQTIFHAHIHVIGGGKVVGLPG
jgi:histidine triad (HIT) family protein